MLWECHIICAHWIKGREQMQSTILKRRLQHVSRWKDVYKRQVFAVTIRPDDYELAKKVMEHIVSLVDGYFCADNENLQPRIPAKEAEQTTVES